MDDRWRTIWVLTNGRYEILAAALTDREAADRNAVGSGYVEQGLVWVCMGVKGKQVAPVEDRPRVGTWGRTSGRLRKAA